MHFTQNRFVGTPGGGISFTGAASMRTPEHVQAAAIAGSDCATIPPAVFQSLFKHPLTEKGLEMFMSDWAKTGQSIL